MLDMFFSDSKAEMPLTEISDRYWWVRGDRIQGGKSDSLRSNNSKWMDFNAVIHDGIILPK